MKFSHLVTIKICSFISQAKKVVQLAKDKLAIVFANTIKQI